MRVTQSTVQTGILHLTMDAELSAMTGVESGGSFSDSGVAQSHRFIFKLLILITLVLTRFYSNTAHFYEEIFI